MHRPFIALLVASLVSMQGPHALGGRRQPLLFVCSNSLASYLRVLLPSSAGPLPANGMVVVLKITMFLILLELALLGYRVTRECSFHVPVLLHLEKSALRPTVKIFEHMFNVKTACEAREWHVRLCRVLVERRIPFLLPLYSKSILLCGR